MPEIGQQVGSYVLEDWISSDKHTSLFRARSMSRNVPFEQVAIRMPNVRGNVTARKIIRREFGILSSVDHDQVPVAIRFLDSESSLIRSWIDGVSLRDILNANISIDHISAMELVLEACSILQSIHARNRKNKPLIFGRLCPEHIIVGFDGHVSCIGLGRNTWNNASGYTSPEQAAQAFLDWRTDQWSLGALIIHLFTNEELYANQKNPQGAAQTGYIEPYIKRLSRRFPSLYQPVKTMLSKAAGDRFDINNHLFSTLLAASTDFHGRGRLGSYAQQVPNQEKRPKLSNHNDLHIPPQNTTESPSPIEAPEYEPIEAPPKPIDKVIELTDKLVFSPTEEISITRTPDPPPPPNFDRLNNMERCAIFFVILNSIAILYLIIQ